MSTYLKALLLVGFGTTQLLATAPSVSAADLAVKRITVSAVRAVHHKVLVVRDLDGASMTIRRARPTVLSGYDGTLVVKLQYENIPIRSAAVLPKYYLNGQPVLPSYPRGWPPQFRAHL